MFNPSITTAPATSAIIRTEPCGYGSKVVFSDNEAKEAYVSYVQGVEARRITLPSGAYLEGEVTEPLIDGKGKPTIELVRNDEGDWQEVTVQATYPWIRLKP